MKKRILILVGALALGLMLVPAAAPAQAQTIYETTSQTTYTKPNGSWQKAWAMKQSFDSKGRIKKSENTNYDFNGKTESKFKNIYTYDSKGRTKTHKTYEDGKLAHQQKFSYSKNKTTIKNYNGKKYSYKTVDKFSKNKSTAIEYDTKGKKINKTITKFDKKGNIKSYAMYAGSKLVYKNVNTIKKGKVTKSVSYNYEDGKLTDKTTTKNSYSGKYTTEKNYDNDGKLFHVTKYYTEKKTNRHITVWEKHYMDGKVVSKTTYKVKKFKSGKCKGLVKQITEYQNGSAIQKEVYKLKAIKLK